MSQHLFKTIKTVSVHQLANITASSLILHPCLDQVDGVDSSCSGSTSNGAKGESVDWFKDRHQSASFLGILNSFDISQFPGYLEYLVLTETVLPIQIQYEFKRGWNLHQPYYGSLSAKTKCNIRIENIKIANLLFTFTLAAPFIDET